MAEESAAGSAGIQAAAGGGGGGSGYHPQQQQQQQALFGGERPLATAPGGNGSKGLPFSAEPRPGNEYGPGGGGGGSSRGAADPLGPLPAAAAPLAVRPAHMPADAGAVAAVGEQNGVATLTTATAAAGKAPGGAAATVGGSAAAPPAAERGASAQADKIPEAGEGGIVFRMGAGGRREGGGKVIGGGSRVPM